MLPDARFGFIFLPGLVDFSAIQMLIGLVAFDVGGLIYSALRSSPLGHGAHLGGVATGLLYFEYLKRYDERTQRFLRLQAARAERGQNR
jgi:membrane associated rhomboid family serine protease